MIVAGFQILCNAGHVGYYTVKLVNPGLAKLYCRDCKEYGYLRLAEGRVLATEDLTPAMAEERLPFQGPIEREESNEL